MKINIAKYVVECVTCSKVKAQHQKPYEDLDILSVPIGKWDDINMDFITKLPRTRKIHDMIWVIVDKFTKSTHFLATYETWSMENLAETYIKYIAKVHGIALSIVAGRDNLFTFIL